jgi:hypothetical protein
MFPYIIEQFKIINQRLASIMASQDDINAAVTAIQSLLTDLSAQAQTILTDVQGVQSQIGAGAPVDTTALDSAVAGIQAVQTSLDSATQQLSTVAEPPVTPPATPTPPAS